MAGLNPIYLAHSTSYHNSFLIPQDSALDGAVKNSQDNGLPNIAVSPALGKFLNLVVKTIQGQRVLEVGTLGGYVLLAILSLYTHSSTVTGSYSTIWLARDHKLSPELFVEAIEQVARQNLEHAGVANKVTVIVGPAAETLATLRPEQPYDLVFIDADKASSLIYFNEGKRLLRKGGVIVSSL
ncbi:O-methyltransferase [Cyathus striatus]|nr:O-methyltransferase [Cyathus striatus]